MAVYFAKPGKLRRQSATKAKVALLEVMSYHSDFVSFGTSILGRLAHTQEE